MEKKGRGTFHVFGYIFSEFWMVCQTGGDFDLLEWKKAKAKVVMWRQVVRFVLSRLSSRRTAARTKP